MILVFFFLILRTLILFSSVSNLVYNQELCIGTVTKIITQDPQVPIFSCLDRYRWGGAVTGILAVPFFFLFGDALVVLRSVIMLLSLGSLVVLYLLAYTFFNKRTAIVASLLFILSPPNYTRMSFISLGSYSELNFLALLTLFIFFKIFFTWKADRNISENPPANYLYAVFGFLCGFGLLFDYFFLLTIASCLLFWFIFDSRFFLRRSFYVFLIFSLIGFSPWFWYNVAYKWNGVFFIHGRSVWQWFTGNSLWKFMTQFKNLLLIDIPKYFDFKDFFFIKGASLSYIYYFAFVTGFLYLSWLNRRSLGKLVVGLIPFARFRPALGDVSVDTFLIVSSMIFFLVYSLCGFPIFPAFPIREASIFPKKEIFLLTPFIFIIIARFLDIIKEKAHKYGSFASYLYLSVILAIGLVANVCLIDVSAFKISLIPKGYNYARLGKQIDSNCLFRDDMGQCFSCIEKVDKKNRHFVYDGWEWATRRGLPDVQTYAEKVLRRLDKEYWPFAYERLGEVLEKFYWFDGRIARQLADNLQKDYLPYVYRGLGRGLVRKTGVDHFEQYLSLRTKIDEAYRPYFYEGMGMEFDEALINNTEKVLQFLKSVDKVDREYIFKGFGRGKEYIEISYVELFMFGFGRLGYDWRRWKTIMDNIEEKFRPDCYQRLGVEIGWRFIHGMKKYRNFMDQTEERYWPFLYKGLGIGIGWRFGDTMDGCMRIVHEFDQRFWPYLFEGLGIGATKRYGYQLDEWTQEINKVRTEYKPYFNQGINEALGERYEAKR